MKQPQKQPLGVLLLHGFTGLPESVNGLIPHLSAAGIPYRMPAMRGHWTQPRDLVGVKAQDWYDDANAALDDLLTETDKVVVVGLSMGGLITLQLSMARPAQIVGVVTVSPALRVADPLAPYCHLMAKIVPYWWMPSPPKGSAYGTAKNYSIFPTKAFCEFYELGRRVEADLQKVTVPIRVLVSKADTVIKPESAQVIYDQVGSTEKDIHWFERSAHEMMIDWDKDRVLDLIMDFIKTRQPAAS
ncbi:alpha/beta fold hydrolase [bacterium]|nr:alpha/beta fold hydrolase [bacterium]